MEENLGNLPAIVKQSIESKIDDLKRRNIKTFPVHANRASSLGHDCTRHLVYQRVAWEQKAPHDLGLQYIFDEGNLHEPAIIRLLSEAGFDIGGGQNAYEIRDLKITGHIDGFFFFKHKDFPEQIKDGDTLRIPYEVKTMSSPNYASINSYEDLKKSRQFYQRKYAGQIQLYIHVTESPFGVFILKDKQSGRIKAIVADRDPELFESLKVKAAVINAAVEKWESLPAERKDEALPDRIDYSEGTCGRCEFNHICLPDIVRTDVELINSPELETKIGRMLELKPMKEEYEEIDDELKDVLRGKIGICGNYSVSGTWRDYKAQPEKITPAKPASKVWFRKIELINT